jgi:hypothetical protein
MSRNLRAEADRKKRVANRQLRVVQERQRNLRKGLPATWCQLRDVILIDVQYHDLSGSKLRPAAVVDVGVRTLAVPFGTSRSTKRKAGGYLLRDWAEAGLSRPSLTRPPVEIDSSDILDLIGRVSERDWRRIVVWSSNFLRSVNLPHPNPPLAAQGHVRQW